MEEEWDPKVPRLEVDLLAFKSTMLSGDVCYFVGQVIGVIDGWGVCTNTYLGLINTLSDRESWRRDFLVRSQSAPYSTLRFSLLALFVEVFPFYGLFFLKESNMQVLCYVVC